MRKAAIVIAAMLAVNTIAGNAIAKDKEKWVTTVIKDRPDVPIQEDKAYILVRSSIAATPTFMRLPDEADKAKWAQERSEALAKEHAKWVKRKSQYDNTMKQMARMPKSVQRPEEPVEPTEANFDYPAYETSHVVTMGPQMRFSKDVNSVYLQEVPPGRYIYYGNMMAGQGVCTCLGTLSFAAPAGKIVGLDLGFPLVESQNIDNGADQPKTGFDLPDGVTTLRLTKARAMDARLPSDRFVDPAFAIHGKVDNWFGMEIERLTPVKGLFHYERDRMVDEREETAESGTVEQPQKAATEIESVPLEQNTGGPDPAAK